MAIAENGPGGYHRGRIGNIVYYKLKGQNISRKIGRRTKPASEKQLAHWAKMGLVPPFFKTVLEFINIGFSVEAAGTTKNPYNIAIALNFNEIITGNYPHLKIDYTKVILSKGVLKPAQNPLAELTAEGVRFKWDTNPQMAWPESADQVMMLAYFPLERETVYLPFGSDRLSGTDLLILPEELLAKPMHVYLSFVSANRKRLSDSTYITGFNLAI